MLLVIVFFSFLFLKYALYIRTNLCGFREASGKVTNVHVRSIQIDVRVDFVPLHVFQKTDHQCFVFPQI